MAKKRISIQAGKQKGRNHQKFVAGRIADMLGVECGPNESVRSREGGQAGTDVVLVGDALRRFPWSVECKRTEKWAVHDWIKQARNNTIIGTNWLVVARRSQEKSVAILEWDVFCKLVENIMEKDNDR